MELKKFDDLSYKPNSERDEKYPELGDYNLLYPHELPKRGFSYDDALELFENRAYNYAQTRSMTPKYKEVQSPEKFLNSWLYIETKNKLDSLLNNADVEDLIPKKYWDKFSNFAGINLERLYHPHFITGFEIALQRIKEIRSKEENPPKTLLVAHCSGSKPYSSVANYQKYIKMANETRLFDICVLSLHPTFLTPYDMSNKYPFICYDWPHNESPGMLYFYERHNIRMLVEAVNRLGYDRVVILQRDHMKYTTKILKDWGFDNYWDFCEQSCYYKLDQYNFRNKKTGVEIPGMGRLRFLQGSYACALFMRDIFGPVVCKYMGKSSKNYDGLGWEFVPDSVKDLIGYPEGKICNDFGKEDIW